MSGVKAIARSNKRVRKLCRRYRFALASRTVIGSLPRTFFTRMAVVEVDDMGRLATVRAGLTRHVAMRARREFAIQGPVGHVNLPPAHLVANTVAVLRRLAEKRGWQVIRSVVIKVGKMLVMFRHRLRDMGRWECVCVCLGLGVGRVGGD